MGPIYVSAVLGRRLGLMCAGQPVTLRTWSCRSHARSPKPECASVVERSWIPSAARSSTSRRCRTATFTASSRPRRFCPSCRGREADLFGDHRHAGGEGCNRGFLRVVGASRRGVDARGRIGREKRSTVRTTCKKPSYGFSSPSFSTARSGATRSRTSQNLPMYCYGPAACGTLSDELGGDCDRYRVTGSRRFGSDRQRLAIGYLRHSFNATRSWHDSQSADRRLQVVRSRDLLRRGTGFSDGD